MSAQRQGKYKAATLNPIPQVRLESANRSFHNRTQLNFSVTKGPSPIQARLFRGRPLTISAHWHCGPLQWTVEITDDRGQLAKTCCCCCCCELRYCGDSVHTPNTAFHRACILSALRSQTSGGHRIGRSDHAATDHTPRPQSARARHNAESTNLRSRAIRLHDNVSGNESQRTSNEPSVSYIGHLRTSGWMSLSQIGRIR